MEDKNKIMEKVTSVSLTMSRVPVSLFEEFKDLADREFCGDYGMTLKFIWEDRKRLLNFFDLFKEKLEKLEEVKENEV